MQLGTTNRKISEIEGKLIKTGVKIKVSTGALVFVAAATFKVMWSSLNELQRGEVLSLL